MLAYIGLGSNLGDSEQILNQAIAELNALDDCLVVSQSSFWQSAPIEAQGPDFINAVIGLSTGLAPLALLKKMQVIEDQLGRIRPYPNAPRTLDLDLLWMQGIAMQSPELTLPHPRLHQRAFVVFALAQIAPNFSIAGLGKMSDWLEQTRDQVVKQL